MPVTPWDAGLRWVQMCMRVEFHHRKNGLPRGVRLVDEVERAVGDLLVDVSIRFLVSGPVSSIVCVPSGLTHRL